MYKNNFNINLEDLTNQKFTFVHSLILTSDIDRKKNGLNDNFTNY